jgi:hypothetical protein
MKHLMTNVVSWLFLWLLHEFSVKAVWDDAKTLVNFLGDGSLRASPNFLSSVLSGVIGRSCLHDFHAHDLLLVNCCSMRKIVLCNWFLSGCWWCLWLFNNVSRLLVTNGVFPLVDCCCKESFEVFTAVIVSQLKYAFVCKSPAWKFVPCGPRGLCKVMLSSPCASRESRSDS